MWMKIIPFAGKIAKHINKRREQNLEFKKAKIKHDVAVSENRKDIVLKLAEIEAIEKQHPETIGKRINRFVIGVVLCGIMCATGYAVYLYGNGVTGYLEAIILLITTLESSPTVFVGFITLLSVYVGGKAIAAGLMRD